MSESRANWFSASRLKEGPERRCLRCPKRFQNGPGEDFRTCQDCRRNSGGLSCRVAAAPNTAARGVA